MKNKIKASAVASGMIVLLPNRAVGPRDASYRVLGSTQQPSGRFSFLLENRHTGRVCHKLFGARSMVKVSR